MVSSIWRRIWATRPWMSAFLPSPSMIVVFSLSIDDALGAAEVFEPDVLELDAEVFAEADGHR